MLANSIIDDSRESISFIATIVHTPHRTIQLTNINVAIIRISHYNTETVNFF